MKNKNRDSLGQLEYKEFFTRAAQMPDQGAGARAAHEAFAAVSTLSDDLLARAAVTTLGVRGGAWPEEEAVRLIQWFYDARLSAILASLVVSGRLIISFDEGDEAHFVSARYTTPGQEP